MSELHVTSAAEHDYSDALCWYAKRSLNAAEAFEASVDSALSEIAASPERFPLSDDRHRYYLLRRFPYQVIYRLVNREPWIIAVAHTSREPSFWNKR